MMGASVQTKEDIFSIIKAKQSRIKTLGVKKLGLFGSFVRGEQRPERDIYVLVVFEPREKAFDNFIQLSLLLEDVFDGFVKSQKTPIFVIASEAKQSQISLQINGIASAINPPRNDTRDFLRLHHLSARLSW